MQASFRGHIVRSQRRRFRNPPTPIMSPAPPTEVLPKPRWRPFSHRCPGCGQELRKRLSVVQQATFACYRFRYTYWRYGPENSYLGDCGYEYGKVVTEVRNVMNTLLCADNCPLRQSWTLALTASVGHGYNSAKGEARGHSSLSTVPKKTSCSGYFSSGFGGKMALVWGG